MKIVDRYIIKQYFTSFIFITVALLFVMTVFNWLDMNDKFAQKDAKFGIILKYYFYNLPYFLNIIVSICALIASLITFANYARTNELTALNSAGISRLRTISPVLLVAVLISTSVLLFNELFGVDASIKKQDIYTYEIFKRDVHTKTRFNDVRQLANNAILQIMEYHPDKSLMIKCNIQYFSDSLRIKKRIDADSILWKNGNWLLKNVYVRVFSPSKDSSFTYNYFPELFNADLNFRPRDLEEKKFIAGRIERFLTLNEMRVYSKRMQSFGKPTFIVDYEIYNAILFPFSTFFMTFIGAVLGSVRNKTGTMFYFFLCVFICLIYIAIIVVGKILGQANTISPLSGALLPHIVTSISLFILAFRR